jgi:hypothetical protein
MGLSFKPAGTKNTTVFSADPDPNTSGPAVGRILEVPDRTINGQISFGVKFYVKFTNPSVGATIDIVPWVRDDATGNWSRAVVIAGIEDFDLLIAPDLAPGALFFQITALSGTIDVVDIFGAPT